jgi:hypothetical protein
MRPNHDVNDARGKRWDSTPGPLTYIVKRQHDYFSFEPVKCRVRGCNGHVRLGLHSYQKVKRIRRIAGACAGVMLVSSAALMFITFGELPELDTVIAMAGGAAWFLVSVGLLIFSLTYQGKTQHHYDTPYWSDRDR